MKIALFIIGFSALFMSCEKIIAEDITDKTPVILSPTMNDTIQQNPVYFKWEELKGATKYRLEIVSPSFSNISAYWLDSLVVGTDFSFPLDSNEYEMRLTATNGAYTSKILGPIKFWVGVSAPTTSGAVIMTKPLDGTYYNASFDKQFDWEDFTGVTSYEYSLRGGSDFATGPILNTINGLGVTLITEPYNFTEGRYTWGIKAYTATGSTNFTIATFSIDVTNPNTATLVSPTSFPPQSSGPITFQWSNGTDPGTINSPINSKLQVSADMTFPALSTQSFIVQGETTTVTLTSGTYYWRVINQDEAGNSASASTIQQFTVN